MARRRALRLSTRVTLFFATTALLGGIGLTVTTYLFARNSLLDQRTVAAEAAATDNAVALNGFLGEITAADLRCGVRDRHRPEGLGDVDHQERGRRNHQHHEQGWLLGR